MVLKIGMETDSVYKLPPTQRFRIMSAELVPMESVPIEEDPALPQPATLQEERGELNAPANQVMEAELPERQPRLQRVVPPSPPADRIQVRLPRPRPQRRVSVDNQPRMNAEVQVRYSGGVDTCCGICYEPFRPHPENSQPVSLSCCAGAMCRRCMKDQFNHIIRDRSNRVRTTRDCHFCRKGSVFTQDNLGKFRTDFVRLQAIEDSERRTGREQTTRPPSSPRGARPGPGIPRAPSPQRAGQPARQPHLQPAEPSYSPAPPFGPMLPAYSHYPPVPQAYQGHPQAQPAFHGYQQSAPLYQGYHQPMNYYGQQMAPPVPVQTGWSQGWYAQPGPGVPQPTDTTHMAFPNGIQVFHTIFRRN
jgi:hypothetical protein